MGRRPAPGHRRESVAHRVTSAAYAAKAEVPAAGSVDCTVNGPQHQSRWLSGASAGPERRGSIRRPGDAADLDPAGVPGPVIAPTSPLRGARRRRRGRVARMRSPGLSRTRYRRRRPRTSGRLPRLEAQSRPCPPGRCGTPGPPNRPICSVNTWNAPRLVGCDVDCPRHHGRGFDLRTHRFDPFVGLNPARQPPRERPAPGPTSGPGTRVPPRSPSGAMVHAPIAPARGR